MHDLEDQRKYWDAEAASAVFTHPLDVELLGRHVGKSGRILDFGCGYGRILVELRRHGFRNLAGLDASEAMVARARKLVPEIPVAVCDALPAPHPDSSFEAVLLFAVLTCNPRDEDQRLLMGEVFRLLAPGGIVYVSDFLLHSDDRNLLRYRKHCERFGTFGVFEDERGAVLRHHNLDWIRELTKPFENVVLKRFAVRTMRGNPATGCSFLGRKPAALGAG
jgi:SAM-dependent methyltransferase